MDQSLKLSSNFDEIVKMFDSRMKTYEDKLSTLSSSPSGSSLDLKSLSNEFLDFKSFVWKTLSLFKSQLDMLTLGLERHEAFLRRKVILVHGVTEEKNEKPKEVVLKLLTGHLECTDLSADDLQGCHRLGINQGKPRPILVRFNTMACRQSVWTSKTLLKGTGITISEFLTKAKHNVFMEARKNFGVNSCWTSDGKIIILLPDKSRRKIENMADLQAILNQSSSTLRTQEEPENVIGKRTVKPTTKSPRKMRRKFDLPSTMDEFGEMSSTCLKDIEFKDDVDLWEQQKFRKRLQRKTTDADVVTLQDVKDVVLFTAPSSILSPALINMLHLPTTERFLRALILCCQYYLQVSEVMSNRTMELETKIQTETGAEIEAKYRDDLEDLRLLVAKEYCTILSGEGEFAKYHHMGLRKMRSLSKKDATLFETILRVSIQMVWISLGRKHYNQIELEVNRIFKSDIYNSVEHKLNTNYLAKMNNRERAVMFGHCVNPGKKVNTNSPLINEVYCHRHIDYRLFGLGAIQFSGLSSRLKYLQTVLAEPEETFKDYGITLGIIGLARPVFDIMLKEIKMTASSGNASSASIRHSVSRTSRVMSRKSTITTIPRKLYPDIYLRKKEETMEKLSNFSKESLPMLTRNEEHRLKWIRRISARNALKKLKLIKIR